MTSELGLQGRAWDRWLLLGCLLAPFSALLWPFQSPCSTVFCSEPVSSKCLLHRGVQQAHAGVT